MNTLRLQDIKSRYQIIGTDPALDRAVETAVALAPTDLSVLISGESGVGKDVLPKIIHAFSRRKNGKYLAVNCGAIPEGTINAELFGHEKGSFTGAIAERKGYFEEADGGTLFLDEIGELPRETQALLLRVLQSGEYMKVGSSKVQKTNVRIIAATNKNLYAAMQRGEFRDDLFYRLNAAQIQMPALRERRDDIYLLFRFFSKEFGEANNICKVTLSHEAIRLIRSYRWPGNIRELKNVAETITALKSQPATVEKDHVELDAADIRDFIPDEKDTLIPAVAGNLRSGALGDEDKQMLVKAILDLKQEIDSIKARLDGSSPLPSAAPAVEAQYEPEEQEQEAEPAEAPAQPVLNIRQSNAELIDRALEKHGGNIKEAAAELGISERTIYRRLAKKKEA